MNLDPNLLPFLQSLADADGITTDEWCTRQINGKLRQLLKQSVTDKLDASDTATIVQMASGVSDIKASVDVQKAADAKAVSDTIASS